MNNIFLLKKIKEDKERYQAIVKEIDSVVAYEECQAMSKGNDEVLKLCKEIARIIRMSY